MPDTSFHRSFPRIPSGSRKYIPAVLLLLSFLIFLLPAVRYFRAAAESCAVSRAEQAVRDILNRVTEQVMSDPDGEYGSFVTLERDHDGKIAAILADAPQINRLTGRLLTELSEELEAECPGISLSLGSLTGIRLLEGKGPRIPVGIALLASSGGEFENELTSSDINQSRYQLCLRLNVRVRVVLPWETTAAAVSSRILLTETILVGRVPETYVKMGE